MDLGLQFKRLRLTTFDNDKNPMSQEKLCEISGVSIATICKFEHGKPINLSTIEKLCKALNVELTIKSCKSSETES